MSDVALSALCSSLLTNCVLHPIDLIRTRVQVTQQSAFIHAKDIIAKNGVRGLYTGGGFNFLATAISWTMYRSGFEYLRKSPSMNEFAPMQLNSQTATRLTVTGVSALLAGGLTTLVVHPLWLLKTRAELSKLPIPQFIKTIPKQTGFYNGLSSSMLLVFHGDAFLAGSSSKFIATLVTYPVQVIRTRQQEQDGLFSGKSFTQVYRAVINKSGVRGLYAGLHVHGAKNLLYSGLWFWCYEFLIQSFK